MKNFKRVLSLATLSAVVAIFLASCGPKPMSLDANQQKLYDTIIKGFEMSSAVNEIPADEMKQGVDFVNKDLASVSAGFKIYDKKEGSKLAKGTKADALKARFIPVKA